jgi:low-affinity inorganic phosphate transporter
MPHLFFGLDLWVSVSLILALSFVLAFEFINGFHDTANAVAMVIYTKAIPPHLAVTLSGVFNFFGVLLGGVGVAYAIVHLLPVELLINVDNSRGLAMVFSMLAAAIAWNLGTWYFGIPASSSHTLIGSILGVGLANALLTGLPVAQGVNWDKAREIGFSLVLSPLAGFLAAAAILIVLRRCWPRSKMHKTPEQRRTLDAKKRPSFWNRLVLVLSAMGVSFVHGSNDGQKGIGLIMLVLIGIVPAKFMLDLNSTPYQIGRTRDAVIYLKDVYQRNSGLLDSYLGLQNNQASRVDLSQMVHCDPQASLAIIEALTQDLKGITRYADLPPAKRIAARRYLLCLDDTAKKVARMEQLPALERQDLQRLRHDLTATTEYAPFWVILAVALALGIGTLVGWRRVVRTVGEKIGRQGITYAQAMSAQITTVGAIGLANVFSLPVSTTHVLSSGVAGTMVANRTGLQHGTVRNILLAWVLTLPAAMLLSAALFWISAQMVS